MKTTKTFLIDFLGFFLNLILEFLSGVFFILHSIGYTIVKFVENIIIPNLIELLADIRFLLLIIQQALFDVTSNVCLFLSKKLLLIANITHKRSEQLIDRVWL